MIHSILIHSVGQNIDTRFPDPLCRIVFEYAQDIDHELDLENAKQLSNVYNKHKWRLQFMLLTQWIALIVPKLAHVFLGGNIKYLITMTMYLASINLVIVCIIETMTLVFECKCYRDEMHHTWIRVLSMRVLDAAATIMSLAFDTFFILIACSNLGTPALVNLGCLVLFCIAFYISTPPKLYTPRFYNILDHLVLRESDLKPRDNEPNREWRARQANNLAKMKKLFGQSSFECSRTKLEQFQHIDSLELDTVMQKLAFPVGTRRSIHQFRNVSWPWKLNYLESVQIALRN